jgi:hypothetical protein
MEEKNIERGKKSNADGKAFELKVRKDLESEGWTVSKWQNNVKDGKLIPARPMFRGKGIPMMLGQGFPDFIAFIDLGLSIVTQPKEVIGIEVKTKGYLNKIEKEKCKWLIKNNVFSKMLIASKDGSGIKYKEF